MAQLLAGKVVLVTGASKGIGKGIALELGEQGATVYLTARTLEPTDDNAGLRAAAAEIDTHVKTSSSGCASRVRGARRCSTISSATSTNTMC